MDRAIHSSPARQMRIGGIDDGVDLLPGNVTLDQFDHAVSELDLHGRGSCTGPVVPFARRADGGLSPLLYSSKKAISRIRIDDPSLRSID
jgi:hypothetical protein